jgi:hypothetical protein
VAFCKWCGGAIDTDGDFCSICGRRIRNNSATLSLDSSIENTDDVKEMNEKDIEKNASKRSGDQRIDNEKQPDKDLPLDALDLSISDTFIYTLKNQFFNFDGRASRKEYFQFMLVFEILLSIIGNTIAGIGVYILHWNIWAIVSKMFIFWIIMVFPIKLAMIIRRFHDFGRSKIWGIIFAIITIFLNFLILILSIPKGDKGANKYGNPVRYISVDKEIAERYRLRTSTSKTTLILITIICFLGYIFFAAILGYYNNVARYENSKKVTVSSQQLNTKKLPPPSVLNPVEKAKQDSSTALNKYYAALTNRRFEEAYEYLSGEQRAALGTYDYWKSGYDTTLAVKLSNLQVVNATENQVIYSYELVSLDRINGTNVQKLFSGHVTMIFNGSRWIIQDQDGYLDYIN